MKSMRKPGSGAAVQPPSPVLALQKRLPAWRSHCLLLLLTLAFAGLLVRAAWVQIVDAAFYVSEGRKRTERVLVLPAARGDIVDRHGHLLAVSLPMRTFYWRGPVSGMPVTDPALPEGAEKWSALARLLDMPLAKLQEKTQSGRTLVYLKRHVEPVLAAQIDALQMTEVRSLTEWKRFYPDGEASAQVVGVANIDERGQEGVEASLDARLRPQPGRRIVVRNRRGEVVDDEVLATPVAGETIRLTLDVRVQNAAFTALGQAVQEHRAARGAAVVLDAGSGEVLALANWPAFDPNDPVRSASAMRHMRNSAVADVFEPGSTIKPLHIAAALQAGRLTPATQFSVAPGWMKLGPFTIRDTVPRQTLSVSDIVRLSSNIGMVKMMQQVPASDVWESLHAAGFGQTPEIDLPGVAAGRLSSPLRWTAIDKAAISYGYGLSVSLLQLARAYTIFGPAGSLLPLSLVQAAPAGGDRDAPSSVHPGARLSPDTARQMRMMLMGTTRPDGTARRAAIDGFSVGAKTGTSRKVSGQGYVQRHYTATAVGFAPAAAPRFIVAVMVDDPLGAVRGGGAVAAPLLARIMAATLRLNGAIPEQIVLTSGEAVVD